jgi:hypothetical protein
MIVVKYIKVRVLFVQKGLFLLIENVYHMCILVATDYDQFIF